MSSLLARVQRCSRFLTHSRPSSSLAPAPSSEPAPAELPTPPPPPAETLDATSAPPSANSSSSRVPAPPIHPTPTFAVHHPIPPKHGIHVASLHLRSHTASLPRLTFFTQFALRSARALGLPTSDVVSLPTRTSLYTVPRSPFAHKKSQENFSRKEHKRLIKVYDGTEEIVRAWLAYLRKEAMGGVGMKAQIFEFKELGWGRKMVTDEGLRLPDQKAKGEVEMVAEELVRELEEDIRLSEEQDAETPQREEQKVLEETATSPLPPSSS